LNFQGFSILRAANIAVLAVRTIDESQAEFSRDIAECECGALNRQQGVIDRDAQNVGGVDIGCTSAEGLRHPDHGHAVNFLVVLEAGAKRRIRSTSLKPECKSAKPAVRE
jgi:hypothetical protein